MTILVSIAIGVMFAGGVFLLLQKSLLKAILGILLLGNGANVVIFVSGGLYSSAPIGKDLAGAAGLADPVPQALILTAIVIGLGIAAFFLVLALRTSAISNSDDVTLLDAEEEAGD